MNSGKLINSDAEAKSHDIDISQFNQFMQMYLQSFQILSWTNNTILLKNPVSDTIKEMNLTDAELSMFDEDCDYIHETIPNIPVRYNDNITDLNTLLKLEDRKDPISRTDIQFDQIQPARSVKDNIQRKIIEIEANRANPPQIDNRQPDFILVNPPEVKQEEIHLPEEIQEEESYHLSADEKKSIRAILQRDFANDVLIVIDQAEAKKEAILQFTANDILDRSPALKNNYQSLLGFENIKNLGKKKGEILQSIENYISSILEGIKCSNEPYINSFYKQAVKTFGKTTLYNLYQEILSSGTYPSPRLNELLPDTDMLQIKKTIHALDLVLHLPSATINRYRKCSESIDNLAKQMNKQMKKDFSPEPNAQAGKPKLAEQNANAQNPKQTFFNGTKFFSFPKPGDQKLQQEEDKRKRKEHKESVIAENKRSRNELLKAIAHGANPAVIEEILKRNPDTLFGRDSNGYNALHLTAIMSPDNAPAILTKLCNVGNMDVGSVDNKGNTALHLYVIYGSEKNCKAIMDAFMNLGFDMQAKTSFSFPH